MSTPDNENPLPASPAGETEHTADTVSPSTVDENTSISVPAAHTIGSVSELAAPQLDGMESFDPAIHAVDSDGNPKKKRDGSLARRRGRKAGAGSASTKVDARQPETDAPLISSDEAARQFGNVGITLSVMAFGSEWEPRDKAEADGLRTAIRNYFDAAGVPVLPAWVGLALAVAAYSLPRLQQPTTSERLAAIGMRIKGWFARMRAK